jgi:hypothetical protein
VADLTAAGPLASLLQWIFFAAAITPNQDIAFVLAVAFAILNLLVRWEWCSCAGALHDFPCLPVGGWYWKPADADLYELHATLQHSSLLLLGSLSLVPIFCGSSGSCLRCCIACLLACLRR